MSSEVLDPSLNRSNSSSLRGALGSLRSRRSRQRSRRLASRRSGDGRGGRGPIRRLAVRLAVVLLVLLVVAGELVLHALEHYKQQNDEYVEHELHETGVRTREAAVLSDARARGGRVRAARRRGRAARDGLRHLGHHGGARGDLAVRAQLEEDVALLVEDGVRERERGRAGEEAAVGALERAEEAEHVGQVDGLRHVRAEERLGVGVEGLDDLALDDSFLVARDGRRADLDLEAFVTRDDANRSSPGGTGLRTAGVSAFASTPEKTEGVPPALVGTLDAEGNLDIAGELDLKRAVLERCGDLEVVLCVA